MSDDFKLITVCRTCMDEKYMLSKIEDTIISIESSTIPVLELLNMFTIVEINGNLPSLICVNCVNKVTDIFKFKLQCDNSNVMLKHYLNSRNSTDNSESLEIKDDDSDVKQEMVDVNSSSTGSDKEDSNRSIKYRRKRKRAWKELLDDTENKEESYVKSLKSKEKLIFRNKQHQSKEQYLCHICKEEFISKSSLFKHTTDKHKDSGEDSENSDDIEQISQFICGICSKSFKSKYILTVHEKRHSHKGQFLCTTCGKGFNSKGCLNRHMRVHTGEKKYECKECKKRFPSSNNLNLHYRIHSGVKPYLCTICGKSFTHPTGLTYHVRTHTKEKNYRCEFCGKSFAIQCHLDNHRKIHTGERPFGCTQCEKAFIKKVDLQRHEAVHAGIKPHICGVCDKEFLRPLHLNYHMMIHTEERPHKCPTCGKGFIRRYYLKDHMIKHHGVSDLLKKTDDEKVNL